MSLSSKQYTVDDLFKLIAEYSKSHPEQTRDSGVVEGSPAEVYTAGAIDFIRWLRLGKKYPYAEETYEDISDEDWKWVESQGLLLDDKDETKNCERDETY